jgi:hypothetical protein
MAFGDCALPSQGNFGPAAIQFWKKAHPENFLSRRVIEAPNPKLQHPEKHQEPSFNLGVERY